MLLLSSVAARAGSVRTIATSKDTMTPIYVKLGKSTVLRFSDKPRKVVVGNQNYYGLEFIENDLAIQPLGPVSTNLFVYTESRTYGFILTPGERYDDLVFVHWGQVAKQEEVDRPQVRDRETRPGLVVKIGKDLKLTVVSVKMQAALGVYLIDCIVENAGKKEIEISKLKLWATRKNVPMTKQETALEKERLKPGGRSKARLVIKLDEKSDFSIEAKLDAEAAKLTLVRRFL